MAQTQPHPWSLMPLITFLCLHDSSCSHIPFLQPHCNIMMTVTVTSAIAATFEISVSFVLLIQHSRYSLFHVKLWSQTAQFISQLCHSPPGQVSVPQFLCLQNGNNNSTH